MWDALYWLYMANAVLIIDHEIDSAYWREWNLFFRRAEASADGDDHRQMAGFLAVHIPMLFLILYGLVEVYACSFTGLVLSLILSAGGLFAFVFHTIFIRRGRPEFNTPASKFLLAAMLPVSLAQAAVTIQLF